VSDDWFTTGLIKRGMAPHLARAFAINGLDESNLDPGINEIAPLVPGSRGGFGAMQWTGPRRRALESFAAQRGVSPADKDAQLDFLMYELQGPEAQAWSAISAAQDTPTAAAAIVNRFLRPSEQHRARREAKYLRGDTGNALAMAPQGGAPMQAPGMPPAQPQQPEQPQQPQMVDMRQDPREFMTAQRNALMLAPIASPGFNSLARYS
jgi:hypothetical protein